MSSAAFLAEIEAPQARSESSPRYPATVFSWAILRAESRHSMSSRPRSRCRTLRNRSTARLYATYLSYVPQAEPGHSLESRSDARGSLAEFIKQQHFGQVFVSRTKPGVTRGNHYHHTKTEKFFVVEGKGLIRMRPVEGGPVEEYSVVRQCIPGHRHSAWIHALHRQCWHRRDGDVVLVERDLRSQPPDTYYLPVDFEERPGLCHWKTMKVATIFGTRPEIIRLSRVIAALDRNTEHVLIHTGQNYDYELNQVFFDDLEIRRPDYYFSAAGKNAAETIGLVISRSTSLLSVRSRMQLLILGDTNSCLAALRPTKLKIPVFHMEAGNRCFDERVPEEINRRSLTISAISISLTATSRANICSAKACRPTA